MILFYTKGREWTWNPQYTPYDEEYIEAFYSRIEEETGRRFQLDNITAAKPGGDVSPAAGIIAAAGGPRPWPELTKQQAVIVAGREENAERLVAAEPMVAAEAARALKRRW